MQKDILYDRRSGKGRYKYWEMVENIFACWTQIKALAQKTKLPFAYRIMPRGKIEKID